ncbi:MAG: hypothetical protein F9K30_23380 [Dechloromonas sp.]|nr:MAG: hypothetical protein F9K30_23380 [Dechloromonas sp.]
MVHHIGTAIAVGGIIAAFLLPASCNPINPKKDGQEAKPPAISVAAASIPKDESNVNAVLEASAKQYILDLYSTHPPEIRRALAASAGTVSVSEGQLRAATADNQAKGAPKDVVIARLEVEPAPPQGRTASVWFVMVRADGSTLAGRLNGWQNYGQTWHFLLAGY